MIPINGEEGNGALVSVPTPAVRARTPSPPSASDAHKRRCYGANVASPSSAGSTATPSVKMDVEYYEGATTAVEAGGGGKLPPAGIDAKTKRDASLLTPAIRIRRTSGGSDNKKKTTRASSGDALAQRRVAEIMEMVEPMVASGAVEPAVDVLGSAIADHTACAATQRYCCSALYGLAEREAQAQQESGDDSDSIESGGGRVADVIAARGGRRLLEGVVRGSELCQEDAAAQEAALRLLWMLVVHERHRPAVAAAGGCGCVVRALVRHGDSSAAVAEVAFQAIKPLSAGYYGGGAAALERKDAARAVAKAMWEHPANVDLQAQGCSVLSNLAVDVQNQQVAIATREEVDAILRAMATHPDDLDVQKQACFALKNLAFTARNAEALAEAELHTRGLLEAAAKRFPNECRKDCKVALKRLAKGSGKLLSLSSTSSSKARPQHKRGRCKGSRRAGRASPSASAATGVSSDALSSSEGCSRFVDRALTHPTFCTNTGVAAVEHYSSSSAGHDHSLPLYHPPQHYYHHQQNPSPRCHPQSHCPTAIGRGLETISEQKVLETSSHDTQNAHRNARGYRDARNERQNYSGSPPVATFPALPSPPPSRVFSDGGTGLSDELLKNAVRSGRNGEYASSRSQFEIVLKMKTSISGPDTASSELVSVLNCLGYACAVAGDVSAAIDKYGKSMAMQRRLLRGAPDDDAVASTLGSLGVLHMKIQDLRTAEAVLTEAVTTKRACHRRLREKTTAGGSGTAPATLSLCRELESLGDLERLKGRPDKAEEMYKLVARWYHSDPVAAETHALPLAGLTSKLGLLAGARGDHDAARQYMEVALDAKRRAYGPGARNADLAATLCSAGYVDAAAGDVVEATRRYEESLDMQRLFSAMTFGGKDERGAKETRNWPLPRSANLARTLTSLGVLSATRGRRSTAQSYLEEALDAKRSLVGEHEESDEESSREFLDVLQSLGEACDEDEDAEMYFEEALEHASLLLYFEEALEHARLEDEDHPYARIFDVQMKIADLLSELGLVVLRRGELESARKRCAKAVEIYLVLREAEEWIPALHTAKLIHLLSNLGYILAVMGDFPSAIDKYDLSLNLQRSLIEPGTFTIELANTQNSLGVLYFKNCDHVLSEQFLAGALFAKKKIYGPDSDFSVSVADTVRNLGEVCMARRKFEKAEAYFEEAFSIYYHADPNGDGGSSMGDAREAGLSDMYSKLGALAGRRGDVVSAREHFEAALDIKRDLLYEPDDANVDLAGALNDLGYACAAQGDYGEAAKRYEEALLMLQCVHGSEAECEVIAKTTGSLNLVRGIIQTLQACSK